MDLLLSLEAQLVEPIPFLPWAGREHSALILHVRSRFRPVLTTGAEWPPSRNEELDVPPIAARAAGADVVDAIDQKWHKVEVDDGDDDEDKDYEKTIRA